MKHRGIALALFVTLVPALAWLLWPARPAPAPATSPATVAIPAAPVTPAGPLPAPAARAAPTAASAASAQPPPLPRHLRTTRRLSAVFDELMRRAESGEVASMRELGSRLVRCRDSSLRHLRQELREDDAVPPGMDATAQANARRQMDDMREDIADCEALPDTVRNSGLDWMERAAATGNGEAQVDYVEHAFGAFAALDDDEVVAQIEEFRRHRDLARGYAAEALARCAPRASFVQYYWGNLLFDHRDARAYAINLAAATDAVARLDSAQGASAAIVQRRQREFDAALQNFDEAARAEARRRGEARFNACAGR